MKEEVFFQDERAKITNLRITCNHITIPIDQIEQVVVNFKVNELTFAFATFLISFVPFYWYDFTPAVIIGTVAVLGSILWMIKVWKNYVEFIIRVGNQNVTMMKAPLNKKEYIYKLEDTVNSVILKVKQEEKELTETAKKLKLSETMKLRMMLKDYEEQRGISPDDLDSGEEQKEEKGTNTKEEEN